MTSVSQIQAPGGFVPEVAVTFGAGGADARPVDLGNPLPVQAALAASLAAPLAGSASVSGIVGPFAPDLGRAIWVTLSGSWTGSVTVKRSMGDAAPKLPLTVAGAEWGSFSDNVQEIVGEETVAGARWWLDFARTSGTLTYEVRQ